MKWKQIPLGPIQTNCYILYNQEKEGVIFDPGGDSSRLISWLEEANIRPQAILLTHAHFDHIGAVDDVRSHWNIEAYLHKNEQDWLRDPTKNGSISWNQPKSIKEAEHLIQAEGKLTVGNFSFDVLETPGHSPGSVSYYSAENGIVFSGDVLFANSIGRTDLLESNHQQLLESIHEKLLVLPEETIVACGHGPTTTIRQEMDHNPFLSGF